MKKRPRLPRASWPSNPPPTQTNSPGRREAGGVRDAARGTLPTLGFGSAPPLRQGLFGGLVLPVPPALKNEVWVILRPQPLVLQMLSLWEKRPGASETSLCMDALLQGHKSIGVWMVRGGSG